MNSKTRILLDEATFALKKIYGERLSQIILFGSYARNEQHPESDVDLLVVLKDDNLRLGQEIRTINKSIFDISLRNDISISVHPVTSDKFESEKSFFMNRVRAEGIVL